MLCRRFSVIMLTGDNERVAAGVSTQVGADEYRAALLPEDKLRAIETLNAERAPVAMVGDGINEW
jgi:P-type E1-E2 ATPase